MRVRVRERERERERKREREKERERGGGGSSRSFPTYRFILARSKAMIRVLRDTSHAGATLRKTFLKTREKTNSAPARAHSRTLNAQLVGAVHRTTALVPGVRHRATRRSHRPRRRVVHRRRDKLKQVQFLSCTFCGTKLASRGRWAGCVGE